MYCVHSKYIANSNLKSKCKQNRWLKIMLVYCTKPYILETIPTEGTLNIPYIWPSSIKKMMAGVPHGLILCPLLFITFMNAIHFVSNKYTFVLHAHDKTLISPLCPFIHCNGNDLIHVRTTMTLELAETSDWLGFNKRSPNTAWTKVMLFDN